MKKARIILLILGAIFVLWTGYLFISSLEQPEHVHSRDDAPQQTNTNQQNSAEAIKALEARLQAEPDNFDILNHLGHLYLDSKQYEKAETIFRKAIEVKPENPEVRVDLGTALRGRGRFTEALEVLLNTTRKFPEYGDAWLQLGVLYRFNLLDNEKALENFRKFLLLESGSKLAPRVRQEIERIESELKQ